MLCKKVRFLLNWDFILIFIRFEREKVKNQSTTKQKHFIIKSKNKRTIYQINIKRFTDFFCFWFRTCALTKDKCYKSEKIIFNRETIFFCGCCYNFENKFEMFVKHLVQRWLCSNKNKMWNNYIFFLKLIHCY